MGGPRRQGEDRARTGPSEPCRRSPTRTTRGGRHAAGGLVCRSGVLQARLAPNRPELSGAWRSRLIYHHPLASGDTVQSRVPYRPDQVEVSPTLGLGRIPAPRPEGVQVHWLHPSTYFDILGGQRPQANRNTAGGETPAAPAG